MRVIAILETRNEERFIAACLENLLKQEIEVYLIDSESTDQTVAIAERYLDRGLIRIEGKITNNHHHITSRSVREAYKIPETEENSPKQPQRK